MTMRALAMRVPGLSVLGALLPSIKPFGAHAFSRGLSTTPAVGPRDVCIVAAARTPIGGYNGTLAKLSAPQLGAHAIKAACERAGVGVDSVQEVYMGNVLSANIGQAPARQAALAAGLLTSTVCTTVNKVCASGMKALMLGSQQIQLGFADVVLAGGMESMTNVPYYAPKARFGARMGDTTLVDGMVKDGLWDPYNEFHMGMCAEDCAQLHKVSRADQDDHAMESYRRSRAATDAGHFRREIAPMVIPGRKGDMTVDSDEEVFNDASKLASARAAFKRDGTVTAGNSSTLSDGAAAILVVSGEEASRRGLPVLARLRGYADAAQDPIQFTTSPSLAIPLALSRAGVAQTEVDAFEINEAFSVVSVANNRILGLDPERVNMFGGAVSMGHPIGASGMRIIVTLLTALDHVDGRFGVASICNGGGGASAVVLERISGAA